MDLETRASTRTWLQEPIDGRLAAGVGIAWFVAYEVAAAVEPVTHRPEPWYGVVLGVAFMGMLAATATGLIAQRRWGVAVSVAAAGFFTALSVACPVSGHHPFGAWWFAQMACALGMLGFSWFALGRPTSEPRTEPATGAERATGAEPVDAVTAGDAASRG